MKIDDNKNKSEMNSFRTHKARVLRRIRRLRDLCPSQSQVDFVNKALYDVVYGSKDFVNRCAE